MPRMPFIGVRISWLMLARNELLAWLALSAAASAPLSCSRISRRRRRRRPIQNASAASTTSNPAVMAISASVVRCQCARIRSSVTRMATTVGYARDRVGATSRLRDSDGSTTRGPAMNAVRGILAPDRFSTLKTGPCAKLLPTNASIGGWRASSRPSRRSSSTVTPSRAESMDS